MFYYQQSDIYPNLITKQEKREPSARRMQTVES